jgi:hypothetical protein
VLRQQRELNGLGHLQLELQRAPLIFGEMFQTDAARVIHLHQPRLHVIVAHIAQAERTVAGFFNRLIQRIQMIQNCLVVFIAQLEVLLGCGRVDSHQTGCSLGR